MTHRVYTAQSSIQQSVRNSHVLGNHVGQEPKYSRMCSGCRAVVSARIFQVRK